MKSVTTQKGQDGQGGQESRERQERKSHRKKDAMVLRTLREIKGLSRKDAALLLDIGHKAIEKFENGRTLLSRSRIEKTIRAYGLTYDDFLLCRKGQSGQVKKKFCHKKEGGIDNDKKEGADKPPSRDNKKSRRFFAKIITKEVQVLQTLRRLKDLSQNKASLLCGYHQRAMSNIEGGRVKLSPKRIAHIVKSYGFTMDDFEYHMKSDSLITDIQDECISIIRKMDERKLRTVHQLLSTFKS